MLLCVAEQSKHRRTPAENPGERSRMEKITNVFKNENAVRTWCCANADTRFKHAQMATARNRQEFQRNSPLTICYRRPRWTGSRTVKAHLVAFDRLQFFKLLVLVLRVNADFTLSGGGDASIVSDIS